MGTLATEDHQENSDEESTHDHDILAAHTLTENSNSKDTCNNWLQTADNSDSGHIKVVYATESDINGDAALQTAENQTGQGLAVDGIIQHRFCIAIDHQEHHYGADNATDERELHDGDSASIFEELLHGIHVACHEHSVNHIVGEAEIWPVHAIILHIHCLKLHEIIIFPMCSLLGVLATG